MEASAVANTAARRIIGGRVYNNFLLYVSHRYHQSHYPSTCRRGEGRTRVPEEVTTTSSQSSSASPSINPCFSPIPPRPCHSILELVSPLVSSSESLDSEDPDEVGLESEGGDGR